MLALPAVDAPARRAGPAPAPAAPFRRAGDRAAHRDPHAYCAHPHLAALPSGRWLLVFNRSYRRPVVLHPPQDPEYRNLLMHSDDEGETWSAPRAVPDYRFHGVECAGLTALPSGRVLLNQWRFDWSPLPEPRPDPAAPRVPAAALLRGRALPNGGAGAGAAEAWPWARGGGETWVHRSEDGGLTFPHSVRIDTAPHSGGYGMRGAVAFEDGELLLPLSDVPAYRAVFAVRSRDGGASWGRPEPVAAAPGRSFEEPAGIALGGGRALLLLRENASGSLHAVRTEDRGRTWSRPEPTGIPEYPAHLLRLRDGRIACVTGRRLPPYGIRLRVSEDGGASWGPAGPVAVRDDLPNADLGYPAVLERRDGALCVAYYAQGRDGVTAIRTAVLAPAAA